MGDKRMTDIKNRAREYLRGQTQLSVGGLFHHNILNLVLGFAEQETKELENENAELKAELKAIDEAGEHARKQITEIFRNKKPYWELEKENAELKKINADGLSELNHINGDLIIENEKLRKENAELTKACDETQELLDKQIEATYKLDKENEELKAKYESVSIIAHNRGQFALSAMRENREYETKFTKAKKIIKTLADDLSMYSGNYQKELLEAKQFLEENSISECLRRATHNYMG